jgi:hypothetical protein
MLINDINNVFHNIVDSNYVVFNKEILGSSKIMKKMTQKNPSNKKPLKKNLGFVFPNKDVLKPFKMLGRNEEHVDKFVQSMQ